MYEYSYGWHCFWAWLSYSTRSVLRVLYGLGYGCTVLVVSGKVRQVVSGVPYGTVPSTPWPGTRRYEQVRASARRYRTHRTIILTEKRTIIQNIHRTRTDVPQLTCITRTSTAVVCVPILWYSSLTCNASSTAVLVRIPDYGTGTRTRSATSTVSPIPYRYSQDILMFITSEGRVLAREVHVLPSVLFFASGLSAQRKS